MLSSNDQLTGARPSRRGASAVGPSPYDLVQERAVALTAGSDQRTREWAVAVACNLLNRCHGRQVRPMFGGLMDRWPSPEAMAEADATELEEVLRPLGFASRRAKSLIAMSREASAGLPAESWTGCGPYALASVRTFARGDHRAPTDDPWVRKYQEWIEGEKSD
jgi:adenine-specific DNA glycosylase